jgi:hypothetical protein
MTKRIKDNIRLTPIFSRSAILAVFTVGAMLLLCGCGDARKVAHLLIRALLERGLIAANFTSLQNLI